MEQQQKFEAWGIVDLFGHVRLAGRISEQAIGGETFIRVDVPNGTGDSYHTRLFGKGAIYGMALTEESIARAFAKRVDARPVQAYELAKPEPLPQISHADGIEDDDLEHDVDDPLPGEDDLTDRFDKD